MDGDIFETQKDDHFDVTNASTEMGVQMKTRKPYGFMQSCSVLLPSQIHMTKFTPHLGYFFQFNQRCGKK